MQITIDKNLVEFKPESKAEADNLQELWSLLVDCIKFNKKLVPVGEYIPPRTTVARFAVEE